MINSNITTTGVNQTMDIKITFGSEEHRNAFATRWGLEVPQESGADLHAPWHLLHHAKAEDTAQNIEQLNLEDSHDFVVQGDRNVIEGVATITRELDDGWFVVNTANGVELSSLVNSIEVVDVPVTLLSNVITLSNAEGEPTTLDPTSAEAQWPRIRTISQYRPLLPSYTIHELTYSSVPELYIVDSGINFDHGEFSHPNLETEDFYTLDVFDGYYGDDIGHGTAVASMAVGKNLGIAQSVKLVNIKIGGMLEGEERIATLLELGDAIDAILARAVADPTKTRVVNLSWAVVRSSWLDSKIKNLLDAGVTVVAAAGNFGISVDDITPAGIREVITVGAIDKYDIPAGFNNISPSDSGLTTGDGLSLDLFAPGEGIVVADATDPTKYKLASGTSLSAPLVAGVAVEIASLNAGAVLEPSLKNIIIDTATEDALLFEDDRFLENQNRLLHFIAGDPAGQYKVSGSVSYLGIHGEDDVIIGDLNSALTVDNILATFPDDLFTYSVVIDPDCLEYQPFISCDSQTGVFTIQKPTVEFDPEVKLKMVKFTGVAESAKVKMTTNTIFFFDVNPAYEDDIESDITLALTEVDSISFFQSWELSQIK